MDKRGKGTISAKADKGEPADRCRTLICDTEGKNCKSAFSCAGSDSLQKCIAKSPDVLKTLSAEQVQQVTKDLGALDTQTQQILVNAFQEQINTARAKIAANSSQKDEFQRIIDGCAGDSTGSQCSETNIGVLKAQQGKLDQENAALQKQLNALAAAQVSLKPPAIPPAPTPTQTPTTPTNQMTGFGNTFGSLLGNQYRPQAGNFIPQAIGMCAPQYTCSGTTLYSRDSTCVDRIVQHCPYGCAGNSCALQDACANAPLQPDPSSCTVGTWKPLYAGSCVANWQCVPGGGGGQPTAEISCDPTLADMGTTIVIKYKCNGASASASSGFDTAGQLSGSATVPAAFPSNGNNAIYSLTCTNMGQTASAQCSVQVGRPTIVLVANPKKVTSGSFVTIGWVSSGMRSCAISSPELSDFSSENEGNVSVNGVARTPPLSAAARFLLHCVTIGGAERDVVTHISIEGERDPFVSTPST